MRIFCSNNPKNLAAKLAEFKIYATVEAEYGDNVVAGSALGLTLVHHGPRKDNRNPCLSENFSGRLQAIKAIGLSHIDLDTLGGTAALMGKKSGPQSFWELAAHIDSNGPHRAAEHPAWNEHKAQYFAYCAWARENQYWPPKDGSVEDVAVRIETAIDVLSRIFTPTRGVDSPFIVESPWIMKGVEFEKKLAEDETRCLIEAGRVRVFAGDVFTAAFYRNADGSIADATVSYGTKSGAITLAFEDGGKKHNAAKIMQGLFGAEAGGHAGIAGSPRGKRMGFGDLAAVVLSARAVVFDPGNF